VTHPKTGHEYWLREPASKLPDKVLVEVYRSTDPGEEGTWFAKAYCSTDDGDDWTHLTHGYSRAQAFFMLYDLMKIVCVECCPEKEPNVPHCYCRDVTFTMPWDINEVSIWKGCCRCDMKTHPDILVAIE